MTPDFDNRLRERFDAAPANEVVPDFNADTLWPRIAERAKRRPAALRIALPWLSHAAAVAAGLLIAWMVLPRGDGGTANGIAEAHKPASTIVMESSDFKSLAESIEARPARGIAKHSETTISTAKTHALRSSSANAPQDMVGIPGDNRETAPAIEKSNTASHAVADSEHTTPTPVYPLATTPERILARQPPPVVVHLLDVTGESGERLRRPVELLPARRLGFFTRLLSRSKVPDLTGAAASDAVVQRTYLSR